MADSRNPVSAGKSSVGATDAQGMSAPRPSTPLGANSASAERLQSLDVFRGAIMLFMASSGFGFLQVWKKLESTQPDSWWRYIASQVEHVPWQSFTNVPNTMPFWGFSLWDLIQPAFMFMVGVSAPYSFASRQAKGHGYLRMLGHAAWRATVLVLMGVFLSSNGSPQTNWAFMNVLSQIGLGYLVVFLLVNRPAWLQVGLITLLLAGHWYAYFQHPVAAESEWAALGLTEKAIAEGGALSGIMAHWNEHTNFGAAVDRDWLNRFPRAEPFVFNSGGYQTINFVASLATMLIGLMIGELLRSALEPRVRIKTMLLTGAGLIAAGLLLHFTCCPIIKRIWTPSWAFYSGGAVIAMLTLLYAMVDVAQWRRWSFPLVVVGMNSIAIYLMSQLMRGFTRDTLKTHLAVPYRALAAWFEQRGSDAWPTSFDKLLGSEFLYAPIVERCLVLFVFWLVCYWMYRQRIFLRV